MLFIWEEFKPQDGIVGNACPRGCLAVHWAVGAACHLRTVIVKNAWTSGKLLGILQAWRCEGSRSEMI